MTIKKLGGKIVIGIILFALVLKTQQTTAFFSEDNQTKDQVDLDLSSTSPKVLDLSLTPHDPILITNNANFDDYGFPGAGTSGDPYIIENYEIETTQEIGISITGTTKHFVIRNCYVEAFFGIYITDVFEGTATIIKNTCSNNGAYGIKLVRSTGVTLTNNTCSNNGAYGIGIGVEYSSSGATLTNNTCSNNKGCGIYVDSSSDTTLTDNTCSNNNYGISLDSSSGATLTNNTCSNNNYGIFLDSSSGATLESNNFYNDGLTISEDSIEDYLTHTVENNWVNDKLLGFYINLNKDIISDPIFGQLIFINCSEIVVCNQELTNTLIGLYLRWCGNATISNNICSNNRFGIDLSSSSGAILTDNTCSNNNRDGIYLDSSSGATLTNNTLSNNEGYGIVLSSLPPYESDSDNNIIHHNIFIDNNLGGTSQAYDEGTNNTWYSKELEEGNYWNEWDSKEPYPIDGDADTTDPYPLNENLDRISYEFIIFIPSIILIASLCSIIRKRKHKRMK